MVLKRSSGHTQYPSQVQHPLWITSCTSSRGQSSLKKQTHRESKAVRGLGDANFFRKSHVRMLESTNNSRGKRQIYMRYYCISTAVLGINQTPTSLNQHNITLAGDERCVDRVDDLQEATDSLGSRSPPAAPWSSLSSISSPSVTP